MRRIIKKSNVGEILRRSVATRNVEYLLNGRRYIAQLRREGLANRPPLPIGTTINEALTL